MRRVLATAGHVDHGKSTLVRALTGRDPDRLAEEQERGYWLYVPGEGAGKWEEFRGAGIMALNWDRIGDPTSYPNEEAVIEALEAGYGDWGGRPTGAAGMIRDFTRTMRPGDVVYAVDRDRRRCWNTAFRRN